jgi:hypothetical protein
VAETLKFDNLPGIKGVREKGRGQGKRERMGSGGGSDPNIVCTYE